MFAKTIIDSDAFLDMTPGARLLYYDLAMRADDDGFINAPKKVMRIIGASEKELSELINSKFILAFDSGVVVVKHWRIHNAIRKDRYKETKYTEEKSKLSIKDNGAYTMATTCQPNDNQMTTNCQPNDNQRLPQDRLGKDRLGKDRLGEIKTEGENRKRFVPPTVGEVITYCVERGNDIDAQQFIDFYASKGWMVGKNKMTDWRAAVRTWEKYHKEKPKNKAAQELEDFYEMTARWAKGENA